MNKNNSKEELLPNRPKCPNCSSHDTCSMKTITIMIGGIFIFVAFLFAIIFPISLILIPFGIFYIMGGIKSDSKQFKCFSCQLNFVPKDDE